MRFDLTSEYLPGCTLRDVRDFFKAWCFEHAHQESLVEEFQRKMPDVDAPALFQKLRDDGFIGVNPEWSPTYKCAFDGAEVENPHGRWSITRHGLRLRSAGMRRYSWKAGKKALEKLMERIEEMRQGHYVLCVRDMCVVGSYARREPDIGDVDIVLRTERKTQWEEMSEATRLRAEANGRNLDYWLDRLHWPEEECRLLLKGRSPILSLLDWTQFDAVKDDPSLFWIMREGKVVGTPSLEVVP